jgi:hypothetical protein
MERLAINVTYPLLYLRYVSVRYLESVTESKAEPIEDIRHILERWGGEACAPSGRQRPSQTVAVVEVLRDVAGARPGYSTEPLGVGGVLNPLSEIDFSRQQPFIFLRNMDAVPYRLRCSCKGLLEFPPPISHQLPRLLPSTH